MKYIGFPAARTYTAQYNSLHCLVDRNSLYRSHAKQNKLLFYGKKLNRKPQSKKTERNILIHLFLEISFLLTKNVFK